MTDRIQKLVVVLLIAETCLLGVIGSALMSQGEVKEAYERGWRQGYLQGTFQVTEIVDEEFHSNLTEVLEYSVRQCLGDDAVDDFLAGRVDSTDTMPAVESVSGRDSVAENWMNGRDSAVEVKHGKD